MAGGIRSVQPTPAVGRVEQYCNISLTILQVQTGDDCGKVSISQSITLQDFLFLNPEVYTNCTNLLLDVAYCVLPVGNINTYSGYTPPPTISITVPPATFSSVNTANPTETSYPDPNFQIPQLPHAPNTLDGCADYLDYNSNSSDPNINSCNSVSYANDVSLSDLHQWNPSLSTDPTNCALQAGYSYCIHKSNSTSYISPDDACVTLTADQIPDGTNAQCVCFAAVIGGEQEDGGVTCASLADDNSLTLAKLVSINPWLQGGDCDTALFANLQDMYWRGVCIGMNATAPTGSATSPPATASPTKTESSASVGMCSPTNHAGGEVLADEITGPTQSGVASDCQQFYTVQSGDSCSSIEGMFAISFADLYKWNPSSKCHRTTCNGTR